MSATNTTLNGALTASATQVVLTAYTAPSGRAKPLLKVDDEIMLIADASLSPTLLVVRGYMGSLAAAHKTQAAAVYGAPADMQTSKGPSWHRASFTNPAVKYNAQEVTIAGSTGTDAAAVNVSAPAFLNCTGTSGAGINLPYPAVGDAFVIKNGTTGIAKVYCVGGTINGTTGTTAVSITATGNLTAFANCATAGAWQLGGNT